MGKRTHAVSQDYEKIAKKIRKLDQELRRSRRRDQRTSSRLSSSSSTISTVSTSSSGSNSHPETPGAIYAEDEPIPWTSAFVPAATLPLASTSAVEVDQVNTAGAASALVSPEPSVNVDLPLPSALDDELLQILGEAPSQKKSFSEQIQPDIAIRLQHIATMGLTRDTRKELVEKYLPPENCTLVEAPTLNPEVIAAVTDAVIKRDKGIENKQKQRTSAISCVAKALTILMSTEPKNTALIQLLMDAAKLMCDNQNSDSTIRRGFILSSLKKDFKEQLQATKIDKFLFSESLPETLKAAKAISKSGADMKSALVKQAPLKNKEPQKHLNWRVPSFNHRLKGTQKTKETAYKDLLANSSKPSLRPVQTRSHRRR